MTPGFDRAVPDEISPADEEARRQEDIARCHKLAVAAFGPPDEPTDADAG
ncbi:hypothetical protein GR927_26035 [Mycolicibacterium sp. 3033]|nr:hypothetical protein [Mycolicibacterium aurantiacum]